VPGGAQHSEPAKLLVAESIEIEEYNDEYPADTVRNSLEDRPKWHNMCMHPNKKPTRPVNAENYDET
jgi:hypothetical protein